MSEDPQATEAGLDSETFRHPLKAGPLCSQLFKTGGGTHQATPGSSLPQTGRGGVRGHVGFHPPWKPGSGQARRGNGGGDFLPAPQGRPGLARAVAAHVRTLLGQRGLPRADGGQQVLPRVESPVILYDRSLFIYFFFQALIIV